VLADFGLERKLASTPLRLNRKPQRPQSALREARHTMGKIQKKAVTPATSS